MSGQQLHRSLASGPSSMGLATVYRNLRQLQQKGMVRCRHLPTGEPCMPRWNRIGITSRAWIAEKHDHSITARSMA